jgi:hypothetical protein
MRAMGAAMTGRRHTARGRRQQQGAGPILAARNSRDIQRGAPGRLRAGAPVACRHRSHGFGPITWLSGVGGSWIAFPALARVLGRRARRQRHVPAVIAINSTAALIGNRLASGPARSGGPGRSPPGTPDGKDGPPRLPDPQGDEPDVPGMRPAHRD